MSLALRYSEEAYSQGNYRRCNLPIELILSSQRDLNETSKSLRVFLPIGFCCRVTAVLLNLPAILQLVPKSEKNAILS